MKFLLPLLLGSAALSQGAITTHNHIIGSTYVSYTSPSQNFTFGNEIRATSDNLAVMLFVIDISALPAGNIVEATFTQSYTLGSASAFFFTSGKYFDYQTVTADTYGAPSSSTVSISLLTFAQQLRASGQTVGYLEGHTTGLDLVALNAVGALNVGTIANSPTISWKVDSVPEPSSMLFLAASAASAIYRRRR